ncbi:ATP-binding protein [Nocardioides aurantiacus]|nr:ATP-binding protein [Nocardioides aurantiacus]
MPNPDQPLSLGLETELAETEFFRDGVLKARGVLNVNGILAIDGVPGTGKTTCARYVAQTCERPAALVRMSHRPAPLELLRRTHLAVTGRRPGKRDTRFQLQNDLLEFLCDWNGVLIVDELQNSEANAMRELTWLYEEADHDFGLIVVGTDVLNAVLKYPQLHSRIMGDHTFGTLRGTDLITAVRSLDRRFADAHTSALADHNEASCAGLLRRWVHTVRWLNSFNITDTVTADDLADVRGMLPALADDDYYEDVA